MQHSGYKKLIVILILAIISGVSCAMTPYTDDDMARLATVARTTMSIIKGKYYDSVIPEQISENEIIEIIRNENSTHFKELDQFEDELDIMIVSHDQYIGSIIWNSETNRKLIQDLQCTIKLDDAVWKRNETGNQFTLDWNICKH